MGKFKQVWIVFWTGIFGATTSFFIHHLVFFKCDQSIFINKFLFELIICLIIIGVLFLLILPGFGLCDSWLWRRINSFRNSTFLGKPTIRILNDLGQDFVSDEGNKIKSYTSVCPSQWLNHLNIEISRRNRKFKAQYANHEISNGKCELKVKYTKIDKDRIRVHFRKAILNPYGGVYPEYDLLNRETLDRIFDYVDKGGIFINVADLPGYYAYDEKSKNRRDTTPLSDCAFQPGRLFQNTPFLKRLGLEAYNTEYLGIKIIRSNEKSLSLHRAVIAEKWIIDRWETFIERKKRILELACDELYLPMKLAEIELSRSYGKLYKSDLITIKFTPTFILPYGKGFFFISMINLNKKENKWFLEKLVSIIVDFVSGEGIRKAEADLIPANEYS